VEDSPQDAALYTAMIRSSSLGELFEVVRVDRLATCITALAQHRPACIVLDMGLPDSEGIEGVTQIRVAAPEVPVVVLTGTDDDTVSLQALQGGAQDYLVKDDVDSRLLARSVRYAIERMRTEQQIRFMAFHDPLTGLANRALFADRLSIALAHSRRAVPPADGPRRGSRARVPEGKTTAVIVLDLDDFKVVNDSLGHSSGDRLLQAVAHRLLAVVRPSDTVARLGGDEFAVLCEGVVSVEETTAVAQRITDVLSAPVVLDAAEVFVGASIGVVLAPPGTTDVDGLVRDADIAMYRAKAGGRGRFMFFEEAMRVVVQVRHATDNALHRALEREEFSLDYQPVVDLGSGRISGMEALLRWDEPVRGRLWPADFLSSAEDSGLIIPIGSWALGTALDRAAVWCRCFPNRDLLTMSVNLSGRQLLEPGVVDVVATALAQARLDPRAVCLCLEVTETVLLEDIEAMALRLTALKALGVRLAVDDFGTGYASLNYLQRLPVDILKVDRAFIAGLGVDEKNLAIVQSLINMGRRIGLTVVAEGVENAEQLAVLRQLGCDMAQGFHMARPLPAEKITELLQRDPVW
jgi:diguanylate cyclase (GGDEF)-like protein